MSSAEDHARELRRQLRLKLVENGCEESRAAQIADVAAHAAEQAQARLVDCIRASGIGLVGVTALPIAIDILTQNLAEVRTRAIEFAQARGGRTVNFSVSTAR